MAPLTPFQVTAVLAFVSTGILAHPAVDYGVPAYGGVPKYESSSSPTSSEAAATSIPGYYSKPTPVSFTISGIGSGPEGTGPTVPAYTPAHDTTCSKVYTTSSAVGYNYPPASTPVFGGSSADSGSTCSPSTVTVTQPVTVTVTASPEYTGDKKPQPKSEAEYITPAPYEAGSSSSPEETSGAVPYQPQPYQPAPYKPAPYKRYAEAYEESGDSGDEVHSIKYGGSPGAGKDHKPHFSPLIVGGSYPTPGPYTGYGPGIKERNDKPSRREAEGEYKAGSEAVEKFPQHAGHGPVNLPSPVMGGGSYPTPGSYKGSHVGMGGQKETPYRREAEGEYKRSESYGSESSPKEQSGTYGKPQGGGKEQKPSPILGGGSYETPALPYKGAGKVGGAGGKERKPSPVIGSGSYQTPSPYAPPYTGGSTGGYPEKPYKREAGGESYGSGSGSEKAPEQSYGSRGGYEGTKSSVGETPKLPEGSYSQGGETKEGGGVEGKGGRGRQGFPNAQGYGGQQGAGGQQGGGGSGSYPSPPVYTPFPTPAAYTPPAVAYTPAPSPY